MCRFLSADFAYALKCPVNRENHTVRFQIYPRLRGHVLDVRECDATPPGEQLSCGKACRDLIERGEYWQKNHPESATFARNP